MKNNIIAVVFLMLSVIGIGIFLIFPIVLSIIVSVRLSSVSPSVGIIGGADGPTAVLVSSSLYGDVSFFAGAVVSIIVFILSVIYLIKNNRKK